MFEEDEKKKRHRKLIEIDVDEITLCASPANRHSFAIVKSNGLSAILKDARIDDAETLEAAEKIPAEASKIIAGWIKAITKYLDDMPDELEATCRSLIKEFTRLAGKEHGYYPRKKSAAPEKGVDNFPSIDLPPLLVARALKKYLDEEEEDEDDEYDPPVKKSIDGQDDENLYYDDDDDFPSILDPRLFIQ